MSTAAGGRYCVWSLTRSRFCSVASGGVGGAGAGAGVASAKRAPRVVTKADLEGHSPTEAGVLRGALAGSAGSGGSGGAGSGGGSGGLGAALAGAGRMS